MSATPNKPIKNTYTFSIGDYIEFSPPTGNNSRNAYFTFKGIVYRLCDGQALVRILNSQSMCLVSLSSITSPKF